MKNPFGPIASADAVQNQKRTEFENAEDDSWIAQWKVMQEDHGDLQREPNHGFCGYVSHHPKIVCAFA
jgi:hypothetical protein